jgi:hypothetical protein
MIIYLIGSNTVVATIECSKGHSWSVGDAQKFLLYKEKQREMYCAERQNFKCPESIPIWKLQDHIKEMLARGEKERDTEKYEQLNKQEELL